MIEGNDKTFLISLDVSTTTIGMSVFDFNGKLHCLTHLTPKVKCEYKIEELIKKVDLFNKFLDENQLQDLNIKEVVIEEPLLKSNNANTVGTLLRFNGMITKLMHDKYGIYPKYITTYESRKNAFPDLFSANIKGQKVLFGGHAKDVDKKHVVWEHVKNEQPHIKWIYDKNAKLKKENYDMSDSYACGRGYLRLSGYI
jgi:hypothetical protein